MGEWALGLGNGKISDGRTMGGTQNEKEQADDASSNTAVGGVPFARRDRRSVGRIQPGAG